MEALDVLAEITLANNPRKDAIIQEIIDITNLGIDGEISFTTSLERRIQLLKANKADLDLIFEVADHAVQSATNGTSGVVGWDEDNNNLLSCIDFNRIKGGKPFDTTLDWYIKMINEIKAI